MREELTRHLEDFDIKARELMDVAVALDFLADVARLAEEAREADPKDREGLAFLARKVQDGFSTILDVLKTHTMWMSEDLGHAKYKLEKTVNDLLAQTKPQKPGPEEEEDINDGCGCED